MRSGTRQFLGKEGIASSLLLNILHHRFGQMRNETANLFAGKRIDWQGFDRMFALHMRYQGPQRMWWLRWQFGIAARRQQYDRVPINMTSQVAQQFSATAIGPLDIVQHNQEWRALAGANQKVANGFPQAQLLLLRRHQRHHR